MGIYDDHDFGWNDANTRLRDRKVYKVMSKRGILRALEPHRTLLNAPINVTRMITNV